MGASYSPNIVKDGLVFYVDAANPRSYPGSGTVVDSMVGDVSGTLQGGTTYSTDGVGSFNFDGNDDYISLSNVNELLSYISNAETITIGQWARPLASNDFMSSGQMDIHPYKRQNYGTWSTFPGNIIYNIGATGQTTGCAIYKAYTNWDNWSYWCCTYDKNQGTFTERLKGYIDGVDPGGWTQYGTSGFNTATITDFKIGLISYYNAYAYGYQGPFHVYNRAISSKEVLQNYNALKGRFGL